MRMEKNITPSTLAGSMKEIGYERAKMNKNTEGSLKCYRFRQNNQFPLETNNYYCMGVTIYSQRKA